jgi:hypothetical protein
MMMVKLLRHLNFRNIKVKYDEWLNKKPTLVRLYLDDDIVLEKYKDTEYYIIKGMFKTDNQFGVLEGRDCDFYFSKKSFDSQIERSYKIMQLIKEGKNIETEILINRPNKKCLLFVKIEYVKELDFMDKWQGEQE